MQLNTLQWPGLWDLPIYIVDYETNKVYDKDHPLPPQKSHLDSVKNRCVRLSAVLNLFTEEMREEAEWTLRQLQDGYDIGKPIRSTTTVTKPETSELERKVTTYIPSVALMAFAFMWPYCQSFQKMRSAVLDYLNNYAESVCIDCGFVQRDCKCAGHDRRHTSTQVSYLGSAACMKDCGVQTEPIAVVGMQQRVTAPGFPVFVPPNFLLSPDVKLPLTAGQQQALTVPLAAQNGSANNTLMPNIINLPPTFTFQAGCPPSFVNPVSLSASVSNQSCVSVLRSPLVGGISVPRSSTVVIQAPTVSESGTESMSRKRRLDTDDVTVSDAAVQTTGKSFVKKMKIRLGDFSASDFKIVGKDSESPTGKNQKPTSAQGVDSGTEAAGQTKPGGTMTKSVTTSPGGRAADVKKDAETPEKRYSAVWKLLEDSSDDEGALDIPTSATIDGALSAGVEKNADDLATGSNDVPISSGVIGADEHTRVESNKEITSAAASHPVAEGKEDFNLQDNDHTVDEEYEKRLVIDVLANSNRWQSEHESNSTSQQNNDWEFRNGTKEEPQDNEQPESKSVSNAEQSEPEAKSKHEPLPGANEVSSSVSMDVSSDTAKPSDSSSTKSAVYAPGSAVAVDGDGAGTAQAEPAAKPRKVYGKFEYTPTGEHILRCLVPKCSQTFDRKLAANVHNHVHPGFVPGGGEGCEGPTYLQCHLCEFQAPFYHWYDLLRHMRQKHDICLVDSHAEHTCEYCGLGFETKDLLVSHIDFHYSNRYKCIYCGLLLLTWGQDNLGKPDLLEQEIASAGPICNLHLTPDR